MKFIVLIAVFLVSLSAFSDEGMWTFNNLPKEVLKRKYGFEPSQAWLDHVMRSSVRFNSGGSGSFVSSQGLVLTNHHVAADTLQKVSTPDNDLYKNGFLARSLEEEIPAKDLELNQLISIQDVTDRINQAVKPGMDPADAYLARRAAIAEVEKESLTQTGLRSDVVTLYNGGLYQLYRYKKYTDVRVVFAPEFSVAFFGGDPDNFEYPRYDLDMTIVRVYENGKPANTADFLTWSKSGAAENELVFVSGHPGRTDRALTVAALENFRDFRLPLTLEVLKRREAMLIKYRAQGPEEARQAQGYFFSTQNSLKVRKGSYEGLKAEAILAGKKVKEANLRAQVSSDPALAPYAQAWERISNAEAKRRELLIPLGFLESTYGLDSELFGVAKTLVRLADELAKPNSDRLPEFRDSALETLKQKLYSEAPIYPALEIARLSDSLQYAVEKLGAGSPITQKLLAGKQPFERAEELVRGTALLDVKIRKSIADGGLAAVNASSDSMIVLAKALDADARKVRKEMDTAVEEVTQQAYADISRALFKLEGTNQYPDATFTLRLAFGEVKGYRENDGRVVAPFTTLGGAFQHEAAHGSVDPYLLPKTWHDHKAELDLSTPYNFVATADIIGGNSGSPVINKKGELVGLIFDGNVQSLISGYVYTDEQNRAVSVHSSAMLEALRKIYGATALANQLGN